ncbi:MAG TPA: hypothetical protein VFD58_03495 [Blastocatellia bacterium]|nr:hypothetical protein [Blastocatellia bacterium]
MPDSDYLDEYLKLKAANDQLRERGRQWLFDSFGNLCAEANRKSGEQPGQQVIQVGYQERQFKAGSSTMVGEAMGVRYRMNTLLIEVGWPRLPEHGFITMQGLARGRVSLSPNPTIDANLISELILKRRGADDVSWYVIANEKPGEVLTEQLLRGYLNLLLAD